MTYIPKAVGSGLRREQPLMFIRPATNRKQRNEITRISCRHKVKHMLIDEELGRMKMTTSGYSKRHVQCAQAHAVKQPPTMPI